MKISPKIENSDSPEAKEKDMYMSRQLSLILAFVGTFGFFIKILFF